MTSTGAPSATSGSPHSQVTVVTPTIPGRETLLDECRASVQAQTVPVDHLVYLDEGRVGPQAARNSLVEQVDTEWILPLDDDDLLDPDCIETLLDEAEDGEIVYPWVRCDPENAQMSMIVNKLFDPQALFRLNFIPCTALIKTDVFRMLGGYRQEPLEDWRLWQRAWLHGVRFRCVPEVKWTYRFKVNEFQAA